MGINLLLSLENLVAGIKNKALPESGSHPKVELYGVSALVIDGVFQRLLNDRDQHPPYGLVELVVSEENSEYRTVDSFGSGNPFSKLREYMAVTIHRGLRTELQYLDTIAEDQSAADSIKDAYVRFKKLLGNYQDLGSNNMSPYDFLESGANTAIDTMVGILEVIPKVYAREYEPECQATALAEIAKNSYSLIARLASGHKDDILPRINKMRKKRRNDGYFNPDYFTIDKNTNGLVIKETKLSRLENIYSSIRNLFSHALHVGCPAMKNFNGDNAVRNLWNWHVYISGTIYKNLYQTTP